MVFFGSGIRGYSTFEILCHKCAKFGFERPVRQNDTVCVAIILTLVLQ